MEKEFVPYEEALALKELGFDEECFTIYFQSRNIKQTELSAIIGYLPIDITAEKSCLAPLYSQVFRWFREKYGLHSYVGRCMGIRSESYIVDIYTLTEVLGILDKEEDQIIFDSHEEAESACLRKLIEIVKEKLAQE